MGSFANITGRIEITPPIPWKELSDSPYYRAFRDRTYPHGLLFDVVETTEDTDEGVLIRREAVAVIPFDSGELRGDDISDVLSAIAAKHGPGRTFTGRIEVWWPDHEFSTLRYKIVGDDHHVVEYSPQVVWPPEPF